MSTVNNNKKFYPGKGGMIGLVMLVLFVSCSSSSKEDATQPATGNAGWTVTISGKVNNPEAGGRVVIMELKEQGQQGWQDTVTMKSGGMYSKTLTLTEPGYYRLNFYGRQMIDVILYKSNLEVNVDGNDPQGFAEVKGSPDIDIIRDVQATLAQVNALPEVAKINEEFAAAAQKKDQAAISRLQAQYQALMSTYQDKVAKVLVEKSPSLAVINLLQTNVIDRDKYFSTYSAVAEKLKKEWPNYSHAKSFVEQVDNMRKLAIGQPAPEISLPNPDGKIVPLSSLRGKYVLLDFWAKWCGPCRQENPNVVSAYQKYKDKGFTVYGVSLDRNKEDWLKAIKDDGLTWTHVSDLKYWQSEAAKTYNITGIPFSLLLDPKGVIVAKNLRGPALDSKLAELLDKK